MKADSSVRKEGKVNQKAPQNQEKKKGRVKKSRLLIAAGAAVLCLAAFGAFLYGMRSLMYPTRYIKSPGDTMEISIPFEKDGSIDERIISLPRGTAVELRKSGETQSLVEYEGDTFSVDNQYLVQTLEEAIQVDAVYPRMLVSLQSDTKGTLSEQTAQKGEKLNVVSVDPAQFEPETGRINWFEVEKDGARYFVTGDMVETSPEAAAINYGSGLTYSRYWDQFYGSGYSQNAYIDQIDYKPIIKASWPDNPMPETVQAVHVSLPVLMENQEELMQLKDKTGINAFVVELKDDYGTLAYRSDVPQHFLSDASQAENSATVSKENMAETLKAYQDAGYYIIGRIVTFKDPVYASQNPEHSLTSPEDGSLLVHNDSYWPSPYSRTVWQYNADIAQEIAPYVNEVQFDYVRFPDGTLNENLSGQVDFKNEWNESKTAALEGFLNYVRSVLRPYHVYLGADVFAWPVMVRDDQDMGQYFQAIASAVDVISPMPYPDHFISGNLDLDYPAAHPYEVLNIFSKEALSQLAELDQAPAYRTWIMGYSPYEPAEVEAEINGLKDAGSKGYMVWIGGNSDLNVLHTIQDGLIPSADVTEQSENTEN